MKKNNQDHKEIRDKIGETYSKWKESQKTPKINFDNIAKNLQIRKSLIAIIILLLLADIMIFWKAIF
jgi:hypothetical protein